MMDTRVNEASTVCDDGISIGSSASSSSSNERSVVEVVFVLDQQKNAKRRIPLPISEVVMSGIETEAELLKDFKKQLAEKNATIMQLQKDMTALEKDTNDRLAEKNDKLAEKDTTIMQLEKDMNALEKDTNDRLAEKNDKLAEKDTTIMQLQKDMNTLRLKSVLEKPEAKTKGSSENQSSSVFDGVADLEKSSDSFWKSANEFFDKARRELEGGGEESTIISLTDDKVSLNTEGAQNEISQAYRTVLEIFTQVCIRVGTKVPSQKGESTGLDSDFLFKMAKKYAKAHDTLVKGKPAKRRFGFGLGRDQNR